MDYISIKGAKENNLKNIDVKIPRDKFVIITGLSGSGKSSLAFDTIYAEGQRRYVESLSAYARQFLGLMEKPNVEYIEGLSPSISIDQKTTSKNPRSTVGTVTEIYDYLRLLYARIGHPHCPNCGKPITKQSVDQIVDNILTIPDGSKIQILAPVIRGKKGEHVKIFEDARKKGFVRVRVDGKLIDLAEDINLDKQKKHNIELVVDRIIIKEGIQKRLSESVETACKLAENLVLVDINGTEERLFSQNYACPDCGISILEIEPRQFSFNSPFGACPKCAGIGTLLEIDSAKIVPDPTKSLSEGAIHVGGWNTANEDGYSTMYIKALAEHYNFRMDVPFQDLPERIQHIILYGTHGERVKIKYEKSYGSGDYYASFEGIIPSLMRRYKETSSQSMKDYYEGLMTNAVCPECHGKRLKKESLAVTIENKNIDEITSLSVLELKKFIESLKLSEKEEKISYQVLKEIKARLKFLIDVGLDYLTLSRAAGTLSGGEAQRIRLATQIGSGLTGVLYILDEPSIGLHQRDNEKLIETLKHLRDLGNTLIVVEHDEDTMYAADHIIDIGPGAGVHGGTVVAEGNVEDIKKNPNSITGAYLSGRLKIEVPKERRKGNGKKLKIIGAAENNLKNIDVEFPLGAFTCVTGVSGSGKSSLINEILYKTLANRLNHADLTPGKCKEIEGYKELDKVINIDQSPIGRTPRSNPATYTGMFDLIRKLFAETNDAKVRGYQPGRFSFNVKGGRCESCSGDGIIKIEMHFLPDVYVPCEVCRGKRYNRETLEVRYKGKNISDVLDMTVEEALDFFQNIPSIRNKVQTLYDVGLGYIKLGQPSTTLSGGEAQRIKLATELSRRSTGKTLYILDEPTTGLHMADVAKLIDILNRLADAGNTIVVIEHNLDVIKTADYIIDLGPDGGIRGGTLVGAGTPEKISKIAESATGKYLQKILKK
ncbi:MAG: excinuclease ABC subunit UvrA [Clostridia bacterium]|nr:excinuclease ABC subunit UvrA [Clostridia bacterium]